MQSANHLIMNFNHLTNINQFHETPKRYKDITGAGGTSFMMVICVDADSRVACCRLRTTPPFYASRYQLAESATTIPGETLSFRSRFLYIQILTVSDCL